MMVSLSRGIVLGAVLLLPAVWMASAGRAQMPAPKGEVLKFTFAQSRVYPGTERDYWVYVPAQYRPAAPACLYVNQDGIQWRAPEVFDELIHRGEMPVTIGVFVMHGRVKARDGERALDRFNRSFEYDGLGEGYVRFLVDELLPDVGKRRATDGRVIRLSRDPKDRAIGGASSGAVCAFTAAWERPDQFSRVFSAIGTYVGLRGADVYPTLIRKYEPKRLRIFLQDGSNDLNIYGGDWWMANQMMERALQFSGYEVKHAWGDGGHNGQHGTQVFPDAMRWLWKGWPAPVGMGTTKNPFLNALLLPGKGWEQAGQYRDAEGLFGLPGGEVRFRAGTGLGQFRVAPEGGPPAAIREPYEMAATAAGDGAIYSLSRSGDLRLSDRGRSSRIAGGFAPSSVLLSAGASVYVAEPPGEKAPVARLWRVERGGKKVQAASCDLYPGGMAFSPDRSLLYVSDSRSRWVWSFQVQPGGGLDHGQKYYWLHCPDDRPDAGAGGMAVDVDGRLYVATALGIQVCDQAGRVNCILPTTPGPAQSVCFGGKDSSVLFAACRGSILRRPLTVRGVPNWAPALKPAPPRL